MIKPPPDLIEELQRRYSQPQRHYHDWHHIEALLAGFKNIENDLHDATAVLWALYWHDAVYDPKASDNETRSADLLCRQAKDILPEKSLQRADQIIRATATHTVPSGLPPQDEADLKQFLDLDLSILGERQDVFDAYEEAIRSEYAFVPEAVYRHARLGILQGFLKRERLYFSEPGFTLWEEQARANLRRSITQLEET